MLTVTGRSSFRNGIEFSQTSYQLTFQIEFVARSDQGLHQLGDVSKAEEEPGHFVCLPFRIPERREHRDLS